MPGQAHLRMVMNGIFGTPASPYEIWSAGVAFDVGDFPAGIDQQALGDACAAYITRPGTAVSSSARLVEVALSFVGPDHRQIGETVRLTRGAIGGGGVGQYPPQVALRVSLGSGLRGRSQRGGFYLPSPATPVGTDDGVMTAERAAGIAASTATFLRDTAALAGGPVIVASQVAGNVPVAQVRVGRALDTIRRRRSAVLESYQLVTL